MQRHKVLAAKQIGPGGINCSCCGPAPGKERRQFFRRINKVCRNRAKKNISLRLAEYQADK